MEAKQRGYTLIEVLVAMLVFSLGLLGMAGLQIEGLKQNQNAYVRSQALIAAGDIADRMRSNVTGVAAGSYFGDETAHTAIDATCNKKACTAAELASYDVKNWKFNLQNTIPFGGGCITRQKIDDVVIGALSTKDALSAYCKGDESASGNQEPITIYVWWNAQRYKNSAEIEDNASKDKEYQVISLTTDM